MTMHILPSTPKLTAKDCPRAVRHLPKQNNLAVWPRAWLCFKLIHSSGLSSPRFGCPPFWNTALSDIHAELGKNWGLTESNLRCATNLIRKWGQRLNNQALNTAFPHLSRMQIILPFIESKAPSIGWGTNILCTSETENGGNMTPSFTLTRKALLDLSTSRSYAEIERK